MRPPRRIRLLACAVACLPLAAGCTASRGAAAPTAPISTVVSTVTRTRPAPQPSFVPAPVKTVAPLPPGHAAPTGEADKPCPYLASGLDEDSGTRHPNLADLEGDRVYRTTVLTTDTPLGCRFYFYAPPYEAVADIRVQRLAGEAQAHNALVLTAQRGSEEIVERNFAAGLTGICYRTRFFGPDGARDWAFAFTKGRLLVVVHTQRTDTSRPALYIGRAIAREV